MESAKKQTMAKTPNPKEAKPLVRRKTAAVMSTGSGGDDFILGLVRKAGEAIKTGRPAKYTPIELWDKFVEYVEWMVGNPAKVERPFSSGIIVVSNGERPLKLIDFYNYAGIDRKTFASYEEKDAFLPITTCIRDIIYSQKFDGAARGVFDSNLIARELGIGERLDVAGMFDPSKPIKVEFGKGNINAPKKIK